MPRSNASKTSSLSRRSTMGMERPTVSIPPLDSSVWNDIYELPADGAEPEEAHGSVIGHLLSQLRPGMDLTRVVLPTWILERRSLLEMFADFFVHPNEFTAIAHGKSPAKRMIQCLRWYLSSFHAGRPSDIAKKPYNPIIGETFICWMPPTQESAAASKDSSTARKTATATASVTPTASASPTARGTTEEAATPAQAAAVPEEVAATSRAEATATTAAATTAAGAAAGSGTDSIGGGPVPTAPENNLTFIAEQVSHRPPVSCFYTESKADRISMTSHIWTKSRFLGLSIGMECVGHGTIILHDHHEEYVVTFPKAYGRSILTTPWFEMGGTCHITCEKTGYSAKIDFHEKPLVYGQKHRITAEVKAPNEKEPIFQVEGHWNDKIYVIESRKKKKEKEGGNLFVDTKSLPVRKKQTVPLTNQIPTESRRQWREVTWCLKNHMTEGATYFKTALEEKQREGIGLDPLQERNREERNIKWTPKYFKERPDQTYVYCSPLEKRLRGDYSTNFK